MEVGDQLAALEALADSWLVFEAQLSDELNNATDACRRIVLTEAWEHAILQRRIVAAELDKRRKVC